MTDKQKATPSLLPPSQQQESTISFDSPNVKAVMSPSTTKKVESPSVVSPVTSNFINLSNNQEENECANLFYNLPRDDKLREQFIKSQWDDHELMALASDDDKKKYSLNGKNSMEFIEKMYSLSKAWLEYKQQPTLMDTELIVSFDINTGNISKKPSRKKGKNKQKVIEKKCHIRILTHEPDVIVCGVTLESNNSRRQITNQQKNIVEKKLELQKLIEEEEDEEDISLTDDEDDEEFNDKLKDFGKQLTPDAKFVAVSKIKEKVKYVKDVKAIIEDNRVKFELASASPTGYHFMIDNLMEQISILKLQREKFFEKSLLSHKLDDDAMKTFGDEKLKEIEKRLGHDKKVLAITDNKLDRLSKKLEIFKEARQTRLQYCEEEERLAELLDGEEPMLADAIIDDEKEKKKNTTETQHITVETIYKSKNHKFQTPESLYAVKLSIKPMGVRIKVKETQKGGGTRKRGTNGVVYTVPSIINHIQYPPLSSSPLSLFQLDTFDDYYTECEGKNHDNVEGNYFGMDENIVNETHFDLWSKYDQELINFIDKSGNSKWFKSHLLIHSTNLYNKQQKKGNKDGKYWQKIENFPFMIYHDCAICIVDSNYWNTTTASTTTTIDDEDKTVFLCQQGLLSIWSLNDILYSEHPQPYSLLQGMPRVDKIIVSKHWCVLMTARKFLLCIKLTPMQKMLKKRLSLQKIDKKQRQQCVAGDGFDERSKYKKKASNFYPKCVHGDKDTKIYYLSVPLCNIIEFDSTTNGDTNIFYLGTINGYIHEIALPTFMDDCDTVLKWTRTLNTYHHESKIYSIEKRKNRLLCLIDTGPCIFTLPEKYDDIMLEINKNMTTTTTTATDEENNEKMQIERENVEKRGGKAIIDMNLGRCISAKFYGNIITVHRNDHRVFLIDTLEGKVGAVHEAAKLFNITDPLYIQSMTNGLRRGLFGTDYKYQSIQLTNTVGEKEEEGGGGEGKEYRILLVDGRIIKCNAKTINVK